MSEYIQTEMIGRVGLVRLNRPAALNALNYPLLQQLMTALTHFDAADEIGALVITGNEKAFAAGADITEMATDTAAEIQTNPFIELFGQIRTIRKPLIAAVSGWCLGGGSELALSCDMIVAADTAKFGQPEINLGVIPGAGGTQRLTRIVGKALAMEMMLNNRTLTAAEARHYGLVNAVYPVETYLAQAIEFAQEIAARPLQAVIAAKTAINQAYELNLSAGLAAEKELFAALFDTADQKEGMAAFLEKRKPNWQGK